MGRGLQVRTGGIKLGISHKLWLSILFIFTLVLLPVAFALDRAIVDFYYAQNAEEMLGTGRRFAALISRAPGPGTVAAIPLIADITGTPLVVVDAQGVVTAGTGPLQEQVGRQLATEQVASVLEGETTVTLASDQALPGSIFVAAIPIAQGDRVTGGVLLFRSADEVREALGAIRLLFAAAGGVLFLLLLLLAWVLSRQVVRPLLSMRDAADRLAHGEYDARVQVRGEDELQDLAGAINRLGESLKVLAEGRRAFFANISHELRTPLSYLQGYAEALAQGLARSDKDVQEYGAILSEESRRLSRLVNDLFELARSDEGRLSLRSEPVELSGVVDRVVKRSQPEARAKGVSLDTAVQCPVVVTGDADRLEQVILNLLDNALTHTPPGGRILINVRQASARDAGGPSGAAHALVSVEDSGAGLQGEEQKIWERFYRGDGARRSEGGGAGLGLAIVKSLVVSQGGRVFARPSDELGGAEVGFVLPLSPGSRPG